MMTPETFSHDQVASFLRPVLSLKAIMSFFSVDLVTLWKPVSTERRNKKGRGLRHTLQRCTFLQLGSTLLMSTSFYGFSFTVVNGFMHSEITSQIYPEVSFPNILGNAIQSG